MRGKEGSMKKAVTAMRERVGMSWSVAGMRVNCWFCDILV